MNRGDLKNWARWLVPGARVNKVTDTTLNSILQEGVYMVSLLTECLPEDTKFNSVADQSEYDVPDDFLKEQDSGLWWYNGSQYRELFPKNKQWLNNKSANWRDRDADDPIWWYRDNNKIVVVPGTSDSTANALWLYYFKRPTAMTSDSDYPFGGSSEIVRLSHLSHNVLDFWKWKALEILGDKEYANVGKTFYSKIALAKQLVKENKAYQSYKRTKLRGRKIL